MVQLLADTPEEIIFSTIDEASLPLDFTWLPHGRAPLLLFTPSVKPVWQRRLLLSKPRLSYTLAYVL